MKKTAQSTGYIQLPSFEGTIPCELSADYILPDTFPDVKRILRTSASPIIISRYVSGDTLEFSGAVDYAVIFSSGDGGKDSVHCVHFAGDFNGALKDMPSLDSADITVSPLISACTARLSNPRKLSIRTSVLCTVNIRSVHCAVVFKGGGIACGEFVSYGNCGLGASEASVSVGINTRNNRIRSKDGASVFGVQAYIFHLRGAVYNACSDGKLKIA